MKCNRLIRLIIVSLSLPISASGIDSSINSIVEPLAIFLSNFIFFEVSILGANVPLIVLWLIGAAIFFYHLFKFFKFKRF